MPRPLELVHEENRYKVEVLNSDSGQKVTIDGEAVDLEIVSLEPGRLVVRHEGQLKIVRVYKDQSVYSVSLPGRVLTLYPADRKSTDPGVTHGPVPSPITGKVIKITVEEGEIVEALQTVAVIEAMKMENEVKAQVAGIVRNIRAEVGSNIDQGTALLEIAPLEEAE